jgi:hypothetical protein
MTTTGEHIETRLAAAAAAKRELEIVSAQLRTLDGQLAASDRRIAGIAARLADAERDVRRLEGLSLGRVLAALKGSHAEDVNRERAERAAEAYRLREAEAQREVLRRDRDRLSNRLAGLREASRDWAAALAEKEEYLRQEGGPQAEALLALGEERGRLRAEQQHVEEALTAAHDAGRALAEVADLLSSARGWSSYDTFFGGGAMSSAIKHDRMEEAQQAASFAETQLAVLADELRDVWAGPQVVPSLGVDGTTRFVDIWFDNIFTDMAVADRIARAQASTNAAQHAVHEIIGRLRRGSQEITARSENAARRRIELLNGSAPADPEH